MKQYLTLKDKNIISVGGKVFEKAAKMFSEFIKDNFDISDEKIKHKVIHTYNVVKMAEYISKDLDLSEEDRTLSRIVALLHDIGRFSQSKEFGSFREDQKNIDHASFGVKILFEDNMIRAFVKENTYDLIIKTAIANHSKYELNTQGMTEKEILHSKLIRDADKMDSFRAKTVDDIYTMANIAEEEIENSLITDKIYNDFMSKKTILSKDRRTGIDIWISYIAFIFDINYKSGLKYIKEKNYINQLVDRFHYKNTDTKIKMEEIRNFALSYIDEQIK